MKRRRTGTPPPPDMSWAWFFDFDGTLVELASSPSSVVVHHELPDLIARLLRLTGGAVSLITGRAIVDIDEFLPRDSISIVGQHGLERRTADGETVSHSMPANGLDEVMSALRKAVARHPGIVAERKSRSIALNYREAPRLAGYVHRLMREQQALHLPAFSIQRGKGIVELKPAAMDKGLAINQLLAVEPFAGRLPVFLGDDVSDEIGFEVVNAIGGHSIKVGPERTAAQYRLSDVTEVRKWLRAGISAADGLPIPDAG